MIEAVVRAARSPTFLTVTLMIVGAGFKPALTAAVACLSREGSTEYIQVLDSPDDCR